MQNNSNFYLHFQVAGDGTEWIDANLPTPNYFYRMNSIAGLTDDSYCIAYLLDGVFGTERSRRYLNDIIARFILTLQIKQRLMYPPPDDALQHDKVFMLKRLQNLKSLTRKYVPKLNGSMAGDDNTFWELKLWIEHRIRDNGGEGSFVEFTGLLDHALEFYDFKDNSTAKAKCRNIWNWYEARGWTYHILKRSNKTQEEIRMTRKERAISNAKAKAEKTRKAVLNVVTGMFADEYKKKSGAWHIGKISQATGVNEKTVSKYLKEFQANN